jgi:hypothetical protein
MILPNAIRDDSFFYFMQETTVKTCKILEIVRKFSKYSSEEESCRWGKMLEKHKISPTHWEVLFRAKSNGSMGKKTW